MMETLRRVIRENFGAPECFFLLGMALLYSGLSALTSPALARAACGAVLIFVAMLIAWKN